MISATIEYLVKLMRPSMRSGFPSSMNVRSCRSTATVFRNQKPVTCQLALSLSHSHTQHTEKRNAWSCTRCQNLTIFAVVAIHRHECLELVQPLPVLQVQLEPSVFQALHR